MVYLKGVNRVLKNINKIVNKSSKAYFQAVQDAASKVLRRSNSLVPVDTGRLRSSGKMSSVKYIKAKSRSKVYYDVEYAVAVHERIWVQHANGESKFLEKAANEIRPYLMDLYKHYLRKVIK